MSMGKELDSLTRELQRLLSERERVIIAIDGPSGGGKTTLAELLSQRFDCTVFHMDDYFLRPEQRTPQRLAEPGGNVDYERFYQEILLPLSRGQTVCFRPYDCRSGQLRPPVMTEAKPLCVVEGSYSLHPFFGDAYDLRVFLEVSEELQRRRILRRPEFLHGRFFGEWIPMERSYHRAFTVRESCDLILNGDLGL